jgi:hydrogenase maturation protease
MQRRGPRTVVVDGVSVGAGSRVRLRPRGRGDVLDAALAGREAVVERVEQDETGAIQLAVTLADDPGRDLGEAGLPGHRFFYTPAEVEPLGDAADQARVLIAGVGNVFLGDDGFGVEVARLLAERPLPAGVDVVDFGIRGMDLVYALHRGYAGVIFVDAAPRGEPPGTLTVLEVDPKAPGEPGVVTVETHGMDPVRVLRLAAELGEVPRRVLVLACEPARVPSGGPDEEVVAELSEPVRAALGRAVDLALELATGIIAGFSGPDGSTGAADARAGEAAEAAQPEFDHI